jgi:mono/diheme cytochrome c family protein
VAGVILVGVTGHFGGNLTHGQGFLTRYAPAWLGGKAEKPTPPATAPEAPPAPAAAAPAPTPEAPAAMAEPAPMETVAPEPSPAPAPPAPAPMPATQPAAVAPAVAAPAGAVSYGTQIAPILGERCYSCHGPDKQKGGLRLDSPAAIRSGGKKTGAALLVAGQPEKSALYTSLVLPQDDDDFMPAKGGPLKPEQIALIRQWIAAGAPFEDAPPAGRAAPTALPAGSKPGAATSAAPAVPAAGPTPAQTATGYDQLAAGLAAPDQRAIAALSAAGAVVRPLSRDGKVLEVNLSHARTAPDERMLQQVGRLGANVAWLDLAGTAIANGQLAVLRSLPNLQRLHLERTAVDDGALAQLLPLARLEYLNLVGTQVSDAGLFRLKGLPALRRLYLWQSKVTKAGAERIAADLPGCTVSNGP